MLENENTGKLRDTEFELNSPKHEDDQEYSTLDKPDFDIAKNWNHSDNEKTKNKTFDVSKYFGKKKNTVMKYILIISFIFFLGAFVFAAVVLWKGSNISSADNINISMIGPSSVDGGEEVSIQILISNKNTVVLNNVKLYLEFPKSVEVLGDELENQRLFKEIGKIEPGGVSSETVKVIFWGEERSKKIILGRLEYQFEGSNAQLIKESEYSVDLLSSPIDLVVDMFKEVNPGQRMEISVTVSSEKEDKIEDTMVEVDYPSGFTFIESTPSPSFGDNRWELGSLEPFSDRRIVIHGTIEGEDTEKKTFRTTVGVQNVHDKKTISTPLNKLSKQVVLVKPFIGLIFDVKGETFPNFSAVDGGRVIPVTIDWINNDETKISDVKIFVKVSGDFIPGKTNAMGGFFSSKDNTATWSQKTDDMFVVLEGGQSGSSNLNISTLPVISKDGKLLKNPEIILEASAKGRRISDVNVPDSTNTPNVKVLRINTEANLTSRAVRDVGPFQNYGPIPPKANQESTYTVLWQITNTANDIENVVVRARIPTYARWIGMFSPKEENITYDEITGEIVWEIPLIPAGSGILQNVPAEGVAFKIGVTPSLTQVGKSPIILQKTLMTSTDGFTNTQINDETRKLTTSIETDPYFKRDDGEVIE